MPDLEVSEGDVLKLGCYSGYEFTVLHTPRHTPSSICLYCERAGILFTGDTLFHYGRGRTDFKYGSESDILKSLERLCLLDGSTVFYSGHGASAHIEDERRLWL